MSKRTELCAAQDSSPSTVQRIDEDAARRWYPVIDYSRCTNCMECIDFCLFGVYGVDRVETILVEQPDNCRKGCPACSRVCPENAIIFPQHKTPAIAGSNELAAGAQDRSVAVVRCTGRRRSAIEVAASRAGRAAGNGRTRNGRPECRHSQTPHANRTDPKTNWTGWSINSTIWTFNPSRVRCPDQLTAWSAAADPTRIIEEGMTNARQPTFRTARHIANHQYRRVQIRAAG